MRVLRFSDHGPAVQLLQLALGRAGFGPLARDGIFGLRTREALLRFQAANALSADGVAGARTHRALMPWYTGFVRHRVRRGESFYSVARLYGARPEAVELANSAYEAHALPVGAVIAVPLPFAVVPTDIAVCSALVTFCVRGLTARYPFLTAAAAGRSVMGRPLWALSLGAGENRVLYNAAHHANEWITTLLLLRFAEELCEAFAQSGTIFGRSAAEIVSYAHLCLVPLVNPDGVDLVTGELQSGPRYTAARAIAARLPELWETARAIKFAAGFTAPAPMNYVGPAPLSAPESRAMADLMRTFDPALVQAWHTQGEVIYWRFADYEVAGAADIAGTFSAVSGYASAETPYAASFAGFKDLFIQDYRRPGFTIEAGRGVNPLPLEDFDAIYAASRGILTLGTLVT